MNSFYQQPGAARESLPDAGVIAKASIKVSYGDLDCEVVEPKLLSREALEVLTRKLLPLYSRGFLRSSNESDLASTLESYQDLKAHLSDAGRLRLLNLEGRSVGVVCADFVTTPFGEVYHLQGVILDPALQGKGLAKKALADDMRGQRPKFLAFHTQSRFMLSLGSKLANLSEDLSTRLAPYFSHVSLTGGVDKGRYGSKPLYGDHEALKDLAISGLDVLAGDAVFAAGTLKGIRHE
jgi:hypothetical protein